MTARDDCCSPASHNTAPDLHRPCLYTTLISVGRHYFFFFFAITNKGDSISAVKATSFKHRLQLLSPLPLADSKSTKLYKTAITCHYYTKLICTSLSSSICKVPPTVLHLSIFFTLVSCIAVASCFSHSSTLQISV